VCAALTATLRERTEWDEAPCLYVMYAEADRVRLSPVLPEGVWPGGAPAQVLAGFAADFGQFQGIAAAITPADLLGFAFRTEIWGVRGPAASAPDALRGPRPSLHPDRVEQRFMWAVTCDGTHYVAMQNRGERAILARKPEAHTGKIPAALEQMIRTVTAGAN
jgi:hypothetical protein